jgi:gliding motility-associated lipoprotein GldD
MHKIVILLTLSLFACRTKRADEASNFVPKPKGYNRIDLPAHAYRQLPNEHPYTFEYSQQAVIKPDTFKRAEPHWIYVYYPKYQANIQFTYKPLNGNMTKLQHLIADAHTLSAKHQVKAYAIKERIYQAQSGQKATMFELEGEVPSQVQFYMTDSSKHYLRAALYFQTATANDSLAPVIQYIRQDMLHIIDTMRWR